MISETDRQTDRQTDRETDRQTDRQTHRQTAGLTHGLPVPQTSHGKGTVCAGPSRSHPASVGHLVDCPAPETHGCLSQSNTGPSFSLFVCVCVCTSVYCAVGVCVCVCVCTS